MSIHLLGHILLHPQILLYFDLSYTFHCLYVSASVARFGIFLTKFGWMRLNNTPCSIQLQRLEQEGAVRPDLNSFGNNIDRGEQG